jgi:hypothetical protein
VTTQTANSISQVKNYQVFKFVIYVRLLPLTERPVGTGGIATVEFDPSESPAPPATDTPPEERPSQGYWQTRRPSISSGTQVFKFVIHVRLLPLTERPVGTGGIATVELDPSESPAPPATNTPPEERPSQGHRQTRRPSISSGTLTLQVVA